MPFERLMEQVAALSDEDAALPLGALSQRWGEPVSRITDAIDAVKVMRGERTYIALGDFDLSVAVDERMPPGRIALAGTGPDGEPSVVVADNISTPGVPDGRPTA